MENSQLQSNGKFFFPQAFYLMSLLSPSRDWNCLCRGCGSWWEKAPKLIKLQGSQSMTCGLGQARWCPQMHSREGC